MTKHHLTTFLLLVCMGTSCKKTDKPAFIPPAPTDNSKPIGALNAQKTGILMAQNNTPTKGTVELATDEQKSVYLHFSMDFTTEQNIGSTAVYLSKTQNLTSPPGPNNPDAKFVGLSKANGEIFFKLNAAPAPDFSYVIIWCSGASIPFGNAHLL